MGPKAPLVPLPIMGVGLERIDVDLVGLLQKSVAIYKYILVILDYATRYTEAIPIWSTTDATVASELTKVFS